MLRYDDADAAEASRSGHNKMGALELGFTSMADQQKMRVVDQVRSREIYVNKVIDSTFDGATIGVTLGCARTARYDGDTCGLCDR